MVEHRPYVPDKATPSYIERTVERLSNLYGLSLEVEWLGHGQRPSIVSRANGGLRNVSPRYNLKDMRVWLMGFEEGLMAMKHAKILGYKPDAK